MKLIAINRGDTRVYPFKLKESDGTYRDLTGGKLFFTAKKQKEDPDIEAVISKSVVCTGTSAAILLTHNDTKDLEERTYSCDFQFVSADSSFIHTELATLSVNLDITQRISTE